jgi:trehalose-6-phosphate synthase
MAETRPLFIGDDLTDEGGFEAVRALGGAGILVGPPRATAAAFALPDVTAVRGWLARLDYSKGLQERFLGYERFLTNHSTRLGQVFLLQIAPPSRGEVQSYQEIRATLDSLSGRINGAFADVDWVPVRYVNRGYGRELAGIYRAAKIGLVTPPRDGMNLVAKECIAAQDPEDPGVLILSHFAGAALQLEQAVLVNPYSAEEISDAIALALAMPLDERLARWRVLMENVGREDVMWWRRIFIEALDTHPQPVPSSPSDRFSFPASGARRLARPTLTIRELRSRPAAPQLCP